MDLMDKIEILASAAKYDVSCSSSGSSRQNKSGGLGNGAMAGICHSWSEDGRCISLLKILFSNNCIYDCSYCINRRSSNTPRATLTVDEIVKLTINFYRRNYIEGLFLSSGVIKSPDFTMEKILRAVKKLREQNYNGYIHIKVIPGTSDEILQEIGLYVDRVSVNIELPSQKSLDLLAPEKKKVNILAPMKKIKYEIIDSKEKNKRKRKKSLYVPAGQSTQLIVGATPESDLKILNLSENLYNSYSLKRVYYSAYIPVVENNNLPVLKNPPLKREHRLYQADWLMRFYNFKSNEIVNEKNPFLSNDYDPKTGWALRNLEFFPVDINKASYEILLRVPGIGVRSAQKIVSSRRYRNLDFYNLKKIGIVLKRAKYFITCKGKYFEKLKINPFDIEKRILFENNKNKKNYNPYQLKLFERNTENALIIRS